MTEICNFLNFFDSVRLLIIVLIVTFQVVVNNVCVVFLTGLHHLQDGFKASVQSRDVQFREEGGHARQRILDQRLPHDITQTEDREGQETQAQEGGAMDPTK